MSHLNNIKKLALLLCIMATSMGTSCAFMDFWLTEKSVQANTQANTQAAFSQCLELCYNTKNEALSNYSSCLTGCQKAASTYPLAGDFYNSFEICESEVNTLRNKQLIPNKSQDICDEVSQDDGRQKACEQGVTNFYRIVAPHNICKPVDKNKNILAAPNQQSNDNNSIQTLDLSE